jgi:hypothetical protein
MCHHTVYCLSSFKVKRWDLPSAVNVIKAKINLITAGEDISDTVCADFAMTVIRR